jgi:hypothetical protein
LWRSCRRKRLIYYFVYPSNGIDVVDDSSGATIELVLSDDAHRAMLPSINDEEEKEKQWIRPRRLHSLELGDLIKVKGELRERWNVRKLQVMKLGMLFPSWTKGDVIVDQNMEIKAWQERIEFKQTVLSRPWKLPSVSVKEAPHCFSNDVQITEESKREKATKAKVALRKIDFNNLPLAAHSIRNLKLLLLSQIKSLQRFTPKDLFGSEDIRYAAICVTRHDQPKGHTDRDVINTLLAALNLLLRDGNIVQTKQTMQKESYDLGEPELENMYIVVGTWNLSTTIKSIAKRENKILVRDVWRKVTSWGNGWETTTKGVIAVVVEEVLMGLQGQEWREGNSGVWTRVDI